MKRMISIDSVRLVNNAPIFNKYLDAQNIKYKRRLHRYIHYQAYLGKANIFFYNTARYIIIVLVFT